MNKIPMKCFSATTVVAAVLLTAACSSDEVSSEQTFPEQAQVIELGVKEVATPMSRADQKTGSMDFTTLKTTGFGVYGYEGTYTDSSTPTLFTGGANTPVTFYPGGTDPTTLLTIPGSWKYAETTANLKEWKQDTEYTFFAYAPYMSSAGSAPGITAVKTDNSTGDPTIGYTVAEDPTKSVDLLWGIRSDSGQPWLDIEGGKTTSAVLFTFCHALCALGFQAQVIVDQQNQLTNLDDASSLGTIGSADGCKVTLKSITLTPATPFHKSGVLNLNNTTSNTPSWGDYAEDITSLVVSGDNIKTELKDPTPEEVADYSVMTDARYDTEVPGVTETANGQTIITDDHVFMLIPQASQDYTATIDYFLTYKTGGTYHRELRTGTATIPALALTAGVKYYIKLVFGLTTFKLSVEAVDWTDATISTTIATETGTSASNSLAKSHTDNDPTR